MSTQDYGSVIRARRGALGLNQAQLASRLGVSRNTVAGWETGHSRPDLATLPSLCTALEISVDAFFGLEKQRTAEESRFLKLFFSLDERDREALEWQMRGLLAGRKRQKAAPAPLSVAPRVVSVFVSDLGAAAGFGAALGEAQGERMFLLADEETEQADEVITVSGRSMEPTFLDGDQVLVKHTGSLRPGEIGIFLVDNEGYIKEYREDGLHSHNPAFPTMVFDEGQSVRCVGRVIGKLRPEQIPDEEQLRLVQAEEK